MKPKSYAITATLLIVVGYGSYRLGFKRGAKHNETGWEAVVRNDWNSDPTAKHSVYYTLGFGRGSAAAWEETHDKDVVVCGDHLAELAVEAGNAKVAGKWLAEGFFAPEQLQSAEDKIKAKH